MQINLAKSAGFCFGVKRAIRIALGSAKTNAKIDILGDIVHNEEVVKEIKRAGIKKIDQFKKVKNKNLILPAHGTPKATFQRALKLGYQIIDATCPMVQEIHRIVQQAEKAGSKIIIIGDKKHTEVKGIIGQLENKAIIIDSQTDKKIKSIPKDKKYTIVAQSTQNLDSVLMIVKILKKRLKRIEFLNTVCNPTRRKQQEIKQLPLLNDAMIIIGSKTSANTKRLYQISKSLNKKTFWIQSKKDIKKSWFKGVKRVGITAGASTPEHITNQTVEYLKTI